MCGRFAVGDNHEEIFQQLIRDGILPAGEEPDWVDRDEFHPRYNVAPQSRAAVIRQRSTSEGSEEVASEENVIEAQDHKILPSSTQNYTTVVQTMKWGVLPRGRTPNAPKVLNTINSKIETILEGSYLWSPLVDSKRCVVVCDGYYEWQTKGKVKLPYFIRHPDPTRKLYFAGLWEKSELESKDGPSSLYTFSILTVPARPDMEWLHERMPLIFSPTSAKDMENLSFWIDPRNTWSSGIKGFLESYSSDGEPFTIYRVPPEVGKVGQDSPAFIQPIDERKDGIKASFAKQQTPKSSIAPNKRRRSVTPDSPTKRVKIESPETPRPIGGASPIKKAPPSPKKQTPSKKSKTQTTQSNSITNFFPITSPRKGGQ